MSSQISTPALKQMEKTELLVDSIQNHRPLLGETLAELPPEIFPAGGGEDPAAPDWNHLQDWNVAVLEASAAEVRQTDQEHRENLVRLAQLRIDRREQLRQVQDGHGALRGSFIGTHGMTSLPVVGLDDYAARANLAAREQLREVIARMRNPELAKQLGEPRAGQSPIDLETLANAREAEIDRYEATLAKIENLRKQVIESRLRRNLARQRNRRIYSNVARIQEGLYRIAGLDDLAAGIRPSTRSARKKSEEATVPDPAEPASDPEADPPDGEEEPDVTSTP